MGVVVQQMVPADSAGVLFTWHPSTGDPRQMLITANFGLGEVWIYSLDNKAKPSCAASLTVILVSSYNELKHSDIMLIDYPASHLHN